LGIENYYKVGPYKKWKSILQIVLMRQKQLTIAFFGDEDSSLTRACYGSELSTQRVAQGFPEQPGIG